MVNRRVSSLTLKDTISSGDTDVVAEMRVVMDELQRHNQRVEDDVHNITQHQQESNPLEEMKLLVSQPLSGDICEFDFAIGIVDKSYFDSEIINIMCYYIFTVCLPKWCNYVS